MRFSLHNAVIKQHLPAAGEDSSSVTLTGTDHPSSPLLAPRIHKIWQPKRYHLCSFQNRFSAQLHETRSVFTSWALGCRADLSILRVASPGPLRPYLSACSTGTIPYKPQTRKSNHNSHLKVLEMNREPSSSDELGRVLLTAGLQQQPLHGSFSAAPALHLRHRLCSGRFVISETCADTKHSLWGNGSHLPLLPFCWRKL